MFKFIFSILPNLNIIMLLWKYRDKIKDSSAVIFRLKENEKQTTGILLVLGNNLYSFKLRLFTIELPWKNNKTNVSRIPAGTYNCNKMYSKKLKNIIAINNVPNRSLIRIHAGNFFFQLLGCILVGLKLKDKNNDGHLDTEDSRIALNKLLNLVPNTFKLTIIDSFGEGNE